LQPHVLEHGGHGVDMSIVFAVCRGWGYVGRCAQCGADGVFDERGAEEQGCGWAWDGWASAMGSSERCDGGAGGW
jgi:hypothetical protein